MNMKPLPHSVHTVIVGLGQTGFSCLRFLRKQEPAISIAMMDTRESPPQLSACLTQYPDVPVYLKGLVPALLLSAKRIIVSPGISLASDVFKQCHANNIPIIGDIELFAQYSKAKIIGITGSNGKGTVTTLLTEMAMAAGQQALACGNIGYAALDALLEVSQPDWYVMELSSFQLLSTCSLQTYSAVVLNISPDHLDYHETMEHYCRSKQRIYQDCLYPVINRDDPFSYQDYPFKTKPRSYGLSPAPTAADYGLIKKGNDYWLAQGDNALIAVSQLKIIGKHNWQNALASIAIAKAMDLPDAAIIKVLSSFTGLPHRCQWVGEHKGVKWYNDSKGTNIGATEVAISAVGGTQSQGRLLLIMGGQGKGADFRLLNPVINQYVHAIYVYGEDADKIIEALHPDTEITRVADLAEAVSCASIAAQPGDSVLLSPACASYDMFSGFAHRGDCFVKLVKDLVHE